MGANNREGAMSYENIEIETRGKVGIVRPNRPGALNALNSALIADLSHAIDAFEAADAGCVARVGPLACVREEAVRTAEAIASMSLPVVMVAKESINRAFEVSLAEGVRFERRVFHALFATEDQKEGMAAFVEKRAAKFKHR